MIAWNLLAQHMEEMPMPYSFMQEYFGTIFVCILVFSVVQIVLWIGGLIHAIRNPTLSDNQRLIWVVVILFLQGFGSLIYLLFGRRGERAVQGG